MTLTPPAFIHALAQAQPQGPGGLLGSIFPLILIMGVFYFLIIRPQGKKAKEHQRMLAELKKGDDVITTGGILGRVTGIKDDELVLQVQEGVRIRILRSAVQGRQKPSQEEQKS